MNTATERPWSGYRTPGRNARSAIVAWMVSNIRSHWWCEACSGGNVNGTFPLWALSRMSSESPTMGSPWRPSSSMSWPDSSMPRLRTNSAFQALSVAEHVDALQSLTWRTSRTYEVMEQTHKHVTTWALAFPDGYRRESAWHAGKTVVALRAMLSVVDAGGQAVANYDSVATWDGGHAIVQTALDTWGRVDVVINNAGILRDTSFGKLDEPALDLVLKVHLYGGFFVTRAAWGHMREQSYGRIVNTSSGSGLYGNFGQTNYSAAKMGLVGFTRTLALEGQKYGITANVIAPAAASRMTEDIMPPQLLERLDPDYVSPLVAYLASEACTDTGRIYSVGGGYVARVAILEGEGATFDAVPTPEDVASQWDQVNQVGPGAQELSHGVMEQTGKIVTALGISTG